MDKEKTIKYIFILLFIIYSCIYFTNISGLYEYKNYKKMALTQEQIDKFEQDVKDGKPIDIDDYMIEEKGFYNNKLGNMGKKFSYAFSNSLTSILSKTFSFFSKFILE